MRLVHSFAVLKISRCLQEFRVINQIPFSNEKQTNNFVDLGLEQYIGFTSCDVKALVFLIKEQLYLQCLQKGVSTFCLLMHYCVKNCEVTQVITY